jgi:hypothetical protein
MNIRWLCIISGVMAFIAIFSWPYGYYQLLRVVLCITSVIVAYGFYKAQLGGWPMAFGAIAILFNPVFPIYLVRSSWTGIDLVVGLLFFIASGSINKSKRD